MTSSSDVIRTAEDAAPVVHYGPVYGRIGMGQSLAACNPGRIPGTLTTHKPWVTCDGCKLTEHYRYAK